MPRAAADFVDPGAGRGIEWWEGLTIGACPHWPGAAMEYDVANVRTDPRLAECRQIVRGFGETVFAYVEKQTGRAMGPESEKLIVHVEDTLVRRIEALVSDHVTMAFEKLIIEHPHGASVSYALKYPQRSRHLLRLLTCSFSDLVAGAGAGVRSHHPKVIMEGLEGWLKKIMGLEGFMDANRKAVEVLGRIGLEPGTENDQVLWQRLHEDEKALRTYYMLTVPLLMAFGNGFDGARTDMQRAISHSTNGVVQLNAEQWSTLFFRLFGPIFGHIASAAEQAKIDQLFEPGAAAAVARVFADYRRWLKANRLPEPTAA